MNKTEKTEMIAEIKQYLEKASGVYLVNYNGINVADISELRRKFKKEGVTYKVFKNTLFKRAIDEVNGYDKFKDKLVGMLGVAFAGENFVAPAKIIKEYFKYNKKFVFKGCYIESEFYDEDKLDILASMPNKEEVMAGIIGSIASPATGIVGSINAVLRDLVSLVDEIRKTKAA